MSRPQNLQRPQATFPNVAAWVEASLNRGVSVAAAEFAISMLPFARDLARLCLLDLRILPSSPASRLEHWHKMWRSDRIIWESASVVCNDEISSGIHDAYAFLDAGELHPAIRDEMVRELAQELASMSLRRRLAMGRLLGIRHRQARKHLLENIDSIVTGESNDAEPLPDDEILDPFWFLAKIRIPCLAQFGLRPETLFQLALEGDRQSWQRMLYLDPSVELMPEFQQRTLEDYRNNRPAILETVDNKRCHNVGLTRTACKALVISWACEWSRLGGSIDTPACDRLFRSAYGVKIESARLLRIPDLRKLFNAYAQDLNPRQLVDEDLQEDGEALRKMVQRLRKTVPLGAWDIFSASGVPRNRAASP